MQRHGVPIVLGVVFTATVILSYVADVSSVNVTYDHRAILIDGKRRFLQSGSIHYPRSTPQMWPSLLDYAKKGGLDVVQTYVFWDMHEPQKGTYNFAGRFDLVKFVKEAAAAGLYVNLRIGPYVCAEWNFGGFPSWLRFVPNIEFRTDNAPFKVPRLQFASCGTAGFLKTLARDWTGHYKAGEGLAPKIRSTEMARFVTYIVNMMKGNRLFASQGGPIILAQIENEYGDIDSAFGNASSKYIQWAADLAGGLDIGVPWIMCQQPDAPGDIINTCNGFYCDNFTPNSRSKPKMWTENWTGWFHNWGRQKPHRPAEDIAFAVARFFGRGGSFQNYYMYHGGTNFGRTAGEWITTSYDYDAPLDQYGQPRQPKYGHLTDLHAAIKLCEPALAIVDSDPFYLSLGSQEFHVYANGQGTTLPEILSSSTVCAAFLSNVDTSFSNTTVQFGNQSYDLPPWSVSILPDCKNVVFNTAMVGAQTMVMKMVQRKTTSSLSTQDGSYAQGLQWSFYEEPVIDSWATPSNHIGLQEQINVTLDKSDYLWYTTSIQQQGAWTGSLVVNEVKDTLRVYVNGAYAGSPNQTFLEDFEQPIQLQQGDNTISVLSATLGLQNYGAFLEREDAGIGSVQLIGGSSNNGTLDLSNNYWQYQVGMQGENLTLFTVAGAKTVTWQSGTTPTNKSLVWYKTTVDAPAGDTPVALDLGSMGKGQAWINGNSIGRFWTIPQTNLPAFPGGTCSTDCNYRGTYDPSHCTLGCGEPSQRWYHVPRDWLLPTNNFLVIFEEAGGDVSKVALVTQAPDRVCAQVSEFHPAPVYSSQSSSITKSDLRSSNVNTLQEPPMIHLDCTPGHNISEVVFGSFGNPFGTCGSFQKGSCHAPLSTELIHLACVGKQQCSVEVSWTNFAVEDPCPKMPKSLAVEALCTSTVKATQ